MSCHARHDPTMSVVQRPCAHVILDVVLSYVLSKGDNNIPCPTLSDHVSFQSAKMACHARRCTTVCNAKGDDGIPRLMSSDCVCCPKVIMAYDALVIRPCVFPKDHEGIPRPTSSDSMYCPKEMMACQAQHFQTVYPTQSPCIHATPNVIRLCVQSKGDDEMSRPTSSDCVCCLMAIMAFNDR